MIQTATTATFEDRKKIRVILGRLAKEGVIERVENQVGVYRVLDKDCPSVDWVSADTKCVGKLWLPFDLNRIAEIMPGDIILIAGAMNAGKSALMMNIAKEK